MKTDYRIYKPDKKEIMVCVAVYSISILIISILFYNSVIPCMLLFFSEIFLVKMTAASLCKKRKRKLQAEFKEMLESLAANMAAGYSIESAFEPVYEEMNSMFKGTSYIEQEILVIRKGLQLNRDIEILLTDFGNRSGVDEIKEFAEVVSVAKKSGGNIVKIMKKTVENIRKRQEVMGEIEAMVASKKMEHMIMSIMPFGIVLYMRVTNRGYMDVLYDNIAGIIIMSVCLVISVLAILLGRRIIDIEA